MITLEYVNHQLAIFNHNYNSKLPELSSIIPDTLQTNDASVLLSELRENKFILHYNECVNSYLEKSLNGILWHEFTHMLDYLSRYRNYKFRNLLMQSVSEYNAKRCEMKYLTDTLDTSNRVKLDYMIPFNNTTVEIGKVVKMYVRQSWQNLNSFIVSKKPSDFVCGEKYWFYYLSALTVLEDGESYTSKFIDNFDSRYHDLLLTIITGFENNDIDSVVRCHCILQHEAEKFSMQIHCT